MSVAELPPPEQEFERTPPHDMAAEQCVLGGMMLSQDAIADVIESLRTSDFYRPAHQIIFDAILDLYGRGEPSDAVTIAAQLSKNGTISRVGGAPYLHTLISSVPTAANAGYYAKIVQERATLRRLVEVGTRIAQRGYAADGADADAILDWAEAEVLNIAEKRTGEDYVPLSEIMPGALDEIEAIGSRGGQMTGVPTGFSDLDALTNGLHAGQMVVVAARPAMGKAVEVSTQIPTPTGWTTMGEIEVGDYVIGADGTPTRVVAATEVMYDRPCYEVEFSDGEVIVADAQHQWRTTTRTGRGEAVALVEQARSALTRGRGHNTERSPRHESGALLLRPAVRVQPAATTARLRPIETAATVRCEGDNRLEVAAHRPIKTTEEIAATVRCEGDNRLELVTHQPIKTTYRTAATLRCDGDGGVEVAGHRSVRTTEEIAATLRCEGDGRPNHAVEVAGPFRLPDAVLPIEPYLLGAWLGGGAGSDGVITFDPEILSVIEAGGRPGEQCTAPGQHGLPKLVTELKAAGLWRHKHVPAAYLRASEAQRRALLAGMLDADGHVSTSGQIQLGFVDKRLAEGAHELILSLGYQATMTTDGHSPVHRITFATADPVFRLPRKLQRQRQRQRKQVDPKSKVRHIVDVRPVPSVPVRCIQVDNADHMYLVGRSCIPTHNSTLALDFARAASIKHGLTSAFFSLEMGRNEITMRLLSAEARVALHAMRSGTMQDEDWTRLARRMSEVAEAPLFIDDSPNMSMMEIRAKCRRLKQQHDLRLVVIDYLQLMSSGKRAESRQVEVSEFSRSLKLLAKELQVPVIALSQLNRGPEQRTDKKPMVSDLRESGSIEQDADMVILLHREDAYEKESPRAGEADLIVAKHRNGPTATVTVAFQGHYSRFVDMATG